VQTIKTAFAVVLLLFVLYSGYIALNGTDTPLKPEYEDLIGMETLPDVSGPGSTLSPFPATSTSSPSGASNGFEAFNSTPAPSFGSSSSANAFPSPTLTPGTSSVPTNALELPGSPSNGNNSVPPSTLLVGTETPNAFPSAPKTEGDLASPALPNSIPLLPPLPESSVKPKPEDTDSSPISTSTPTFGLNNPSSVPADLISGSNTPKIPMGDNASSPSPLDLGPPTPQGGIKSTAVSKAYENAKDLAMEQINRGELKDGLATLSTFYNAPELTDEQRQDLLDLLDALAREVVYSRRHMLDSVYIVAPGETLSDISKRYDVPGEIIARINAIESTKELPSGARLKVVPGPFRAEVDLTRGELTVFLGDLYAGRYPVTLGNEPAPKPGLFQVIDKQTNKNYYGNGVQILANDPRNPYGGWWIDLGQDVCIHGSSEGPSDGKLGCISLSPMDASDLFGMLGRGSPVTIKR
jgi:hypothetical protein